MRAAWYSRFGSAVDVLTVGEMATPEPGDGEVRVRLACSGVNPVDVKRRRGGRGDMPAPCVIPHFDGAGTIDRVGAGVSSRRVGERVWVFEGNWQRAFGTAAEFVCLPESQAVPLPDDVGFAEGSALGVPAMTAHRCVFTDGAVAGKTVMVTGGAGAVGGYAVQFAKLAGATVIATVSNDLKAEQAKAFGADHIVNYRQDDVAKRVRDVTGGVGVERIVEVEFGGNLETSLHALAPNGVIAAYASDAALEPAIPFYRMAYANVTVRPVLVFGVPDAAKADAVRDITAWLKAGRLRHCIGRHFSLGEIVAAHQAVEAGVPGKVVIDLDGGR